MDNQTSGFIAACLEATCFSRSFKPVHMMFYNDHYRDIKTRGRQFHGNFGRFKNPLLWRHNGRDSVSNHQPHDGLLHRLFRRRSNKTSKLRVMLPFDDVITLYKKRVQLWRKHDQLSSISMILQAIRRNHYSVRPSGTCTRYTSQELYARFAMCHVLLSVLIISFRVMNEEYSFQ